MIAAVSPPHGPEWSALTLIVVVALTPTIALSLALQPFLRTRQMQLAGALFALGSAAVAGLWLWRHPAKIDDLAQPLVDNIVKFGYPAAAISTIAASLKLIASPSPPSNVSAPSIESRRRRQAILTAAVCVSGLIVAFGGFWFTALPWRWVFLIGGSLTASAASATILFVMRPRLAPHDRAIAQSNGICVKPGHPYQPKDDDRHIPVRRRTSSFPSHLELESRTTLISWTPHLDNLNSFAANFENDEKVDAKLNEWVVMRFSVKKIKQKALGLGILIEEIDAARIRTRSKGLPDAR